METNEYLNSILAEQTLANDSDEMKQLQEQREKVEGLLRDDYGSSPTIRYGGSKAKGTMIREAYDLDVICYFARDDQTAGETLEEIYNAVADTLRQEYAVYQKTSALRLQSKGVLGVTDFHIDVVPGRFTDDTKSDAFLYQSSGEKKWLKTNIGTHIAHVKDSGVTDAIRLMKLWRVRNSLTIKHFALELLVVKLLQSKKKVSLADQLLHVWTEFRDHSDSLTVEDPANPNGNDLSSLLSSSVKFGLSTVAQATLNNITLFGWEQVFGRLKPTEKQVPKVEILQRAAASVAAPTKPWAQSR